MKKKVVSTKKEFLIRRKKKVTIAVGLALFVIGFWLFYNFFQRPIPDEQFALCEQVAQDLAMELPSNVTSGTLWIEVTDDFFVKADLNKDSVKVTPSNNYSYRDDAVVAEFNDGALILERRDGVLAAILVSALVGLLFFIAELILANKHEILNANVTDATSE